MNKRHERILHIINREKEISVNRLSELLKVSMVTIRSDLRFLDEQNLLVRTHGGASLSLDDDISHRMSVNYSRKLKIARAAADEIEDGETILLEAGSSVALLAQILADRNNLNIITNNAFVARQLKDSKGITVILIGGVYQKNSETMVGSMVKEYLSYYNFSKVFMGIDGFTREQGAMCRDLERSEVMSEFVRKGEKVYILSDSDKIGKTEIRSICPAEDIDCFVTDSGVSDEYRQFFRDKGIELILT